MTIGANISCSPLVSVAAVTGGYPFRGPVPEIPGGPLRVVQMKDLAANAGVDWPGTVSTELPGKRPPDLLRAGDVLVLVRGARNPAVYLGDVPCAAVSSLHFFLLRLAAESKLLAEFLAWQINQEPAQRYLAQNAAGTDQRSIRRAVLEALPVVVPPLPTQQTMLELARAARREHDVLTGLIDTRQRELQAVARSMLEAPQP